MLPSRPPSCRQHAAPSSPPVAGSREQSGSGAAKNERASLLNPPSLAGWRHASPDLDGGSMTPRPRPRPRPQDSAFQQLLRCRWCSGTVCCCFLTALATLAATVLSFQPIIVETLWPVAEPPPPPPHLEGVGSSARAASTGPEESARLASRGDGDRHFVRAELPLIVAVQALLVCGCVVCCSRRHGHLLQWRRQRALPGANQATERATEPEAPGEAPAPGAGARATRGQETTSRASKGEC